MKKFFGAPPPTMRAPFLLLPRTMAAVSRTSRVGSIGTGRPFEVVENEVHADRGVPRRGT